MDKLSERIRAMLRPEIIRNANDTFGLQLLVDEVVQLEEKNAALKSAMRVAKKMDLEGERGIDWDVIECCLE